MAEPTPHLDPHLHRLQDFAHRRTDLVNMPHCHDGAADY
jgi:hypothetical protein